MWLVRERMGRVRDDSTALKVFGLRRYKDGKIDTMQMVTKESCFGYLISDKVYFEAKNYYKRQRGMF